MASYEVLYSRNCQSLVYWDGVNEKRILGPEINERAVLAIDKIKNRIKTT